MSKTKHKIFKVKISEDGKLTFAKSVDKAINEFLAESNNVYVNHSVATLTEDVEEYGNLKTVCKFVVISLVYKDLNDTAFDLKKISKKIKSVVHKQIESGDAIQEPIIETSFDKEVNKATKIKTRIEKVNEKFSNKIELPDSKEI